MNYSHNDRHEMRLQLQEWARISKLRRAGGTSVQGMWDTNCRCVLTVKEIDAAGNVISIRNWGETWNEQHVFPRFTPRRESETLA